MLVFCLEGGPAGPRAGRGRWQEPQVAKHSGSRAWGPGEGSRQRGGVPAPGGFKGASPGPHCSALLGPPAPISLWPRGPHTRGSMKNAPDHRRHRNGRGLRPQAATRGLPRGLTCIRRRRGLPASRSKTRNFTPAARRRRAGAEREGGPRGLGCCSSGSARRWGLRGRGLV